MCRTGRSPVRPDGFVLAHLSAQFLSLKVLLGNGIVDSITAAGWALNRERDRQDTLKQPV